MFLENEDAEECLSGTLDVAANSVVYLKYIYIYLGGPFSWPNFCSFLLTLFLIFTFMLTSFMGREHYCYANTIKNTGGQVPFPLAWMCCIFAALLCPFSAVFSGISAPPFLRANKKHFIKISDNKLANMSATAGTQTDVVSWVSLPSLSHVLPPTGRGAGTALTAAWKKSQQGRWWSSRLEILPSI